MQRSKFISWASTSLSGHVALFEIVFGIPIAVLMIFLNYMEGTLTIGWAMWIVGSCAAISIILAIAIWTTISNGSRSDRRPLNPSRLCNRWGIRRHPAKCGSTWVLK
jgi:hypothetical protein